MLSLTTIKELKKLRNKKYRTEFNRFIVEGEKMINELILNNIKADKIFTTIPSLFDKLSPIFPFIELIGEREMKQISVFDSFSPILAVVPFSEIPSFDSKHLQSPLLALDFIQDPGNLGTIIRTADWFGFKGIVCSENTVERFNHKVVQASMGAIFRMPMLYTNLADFLKISHLPSYGTFLNGENLYDMTLKKDAIYVIGNEANGISPEIEKLVSKRLTIPNFSVNSVKMESLNAALSTAIVCSEVARSS
jgi:TrmH family RNA methyltransferase